MIPPIGGLLLAWSDRGRLASDDDWTSDESEAEEENREEGGVTDSAFWTREVLNIPKSKLYTKAHVSKAEALDLVTKKKLRPVEAAQELLMQITGESLEKMVEKDEKGLVLEIDNLARKIRRVESDHKARKFRHKPELLEENLATFSQNSFVSKIREEDENEEESSMEVEEEEETKEGTKQKVYRKEEEKGGKGEEKEVRKAMKKKYRKPLDKCRDLETIADRTNEILETIRSEAREQEVADLQLLSYLMYRVSYLHNRDLAKKMFHLFRSGDWQPGLEPVGKEKMLALTERCRLGKGGFRYLHRQLKPHGLKMPYYPAVAELRRQVCPVLQPYIDMAGRPVGLTAGLLDSLQLTLRRHIQSGQAGYLETADCSLSVGITIGFDGRGGKSEYKQKSQVGINTSHSLSCQYMVTNVSKLASTETECLDRNRDPGHHNTNCMVGRVCGSDWKCGGGQAAPADQAMAEVGAQAIKIKKPFHFQEKAGVVWQEQQLGSTWAARPLAIVMQRETRENTVSFVEGYLNREVSCLTSYGATGYSDTMEAELEACGAGGDWVLYSPRGRSIVSRESCSSLKVVGRTVLQNPLPRRETADCAPHAKRAACEPLPAATPDTQAPPPPEVNTATDKMYQ